MARLLKVCGVYSITNTRNGKRYLGSSASVLARFKVHKGKLGKVEHWNRYLQSAWVKHGAENFVFEVLLVCSVENLLFYEQRAIDAYRNTSVGIYNIALVAGSVRGYRHLPETKVVMRYKKLGTKQSSEHRAAISVALKGRTVSEKNREAMRLRRTGAVATPETRAKQSVSRTEEEYKQNAVKGWVTRKASGKPEKKRTLEQLARMALAQQLSLQKPEVQASRKCGAERSKKSWTKQRRKAQAKRNKTKEHKAKCAKGYTTEKRRAAALKFWAKQTNRKARPATRKKQRKSALKRHARERGKKKLKPKT